MKHYYQILGLPAGASKDEIKKAYRKMAMRYHPDRNPGPEAKKKFMEVLEAYEYLTGFRKMKKGPRLSPDDLQKFYDLMQKAAEEKAKERYRERVRQFRKEQDKKQAAEFQKGIFVLIGIVVAAVSIWQGSKFYQNLVINRDPVVVQATVTGLAVKRMIYEFPIGDSLVEERLYVSNYGLDMLAENGMPLKPGDRFELIFSQSQPDYHKINFEKVSSETMRRYLQLAANSILKMYKEEWSDLSERDQKVRASCISLLVFEKYRFDGLSTIYFHKANPLENLSHNSWRWYFMQSGDQFENIRATCRADSMQLN